MTLFSWFRYVCSVKPFTTPWVHIWLAIGAQISLSGLVIYFYDRRRPLAAGMQSDVFSTPIIITLQIWAIAIGSFLAFDMLLEIIVFAVECRIIEQMQLNLIAKPTEALKLVNTTKEWISRLEFILALLLPAGLLWASPTDEYRVVMAYYCFRFRLLTMFCVEVFSVHDTFRGHYKGLCLAMSSSYVVFGTLAMYLRCSGAMDNNNNNNMSALRWFVVVVQVLTAASNALLNVYLWTQLYRRNNKRAERNRWDLSDKECRFVIYSVLTTLVELTVLVCAFSGPGGFSYADITLTDLVLGECAMIVAGAFSAILPLRIARNRARAAELALVNARRGVSRVLLWPLKEVVEGLDEVSERGEE